MRVPANSEVQVSVIVAVRNEEAFIRETVAAIRAQEFGGRIEFLFVDGRSEDRTKPILEELAGSDPRIRILDNPEKQLASALNIGLRNARGEFVAQMDAHTYYPPNYVADGVDRLRRGDVDWVTGPPIPHGVGPWSRRVALALDSWMGTGGSNKWASRLKAAAAASSNGGEIDLDTSVFAGVWRRSKLEKLGGWDEGWPVNHDSELAARLLESGGRIVCLPALGARYVPRNSLRGLASQYSRYGFYRAKTSRRHPSSLRRSHLLAPAVVLTAAAALLAPPPLRSIARAGLAAYVLAVLSASAQVAPRGSAGDAVGLPVVFVTMHVAWGVGFLVGCVRNGPPVRALARAVNPTGGNARD
jgi:glycosyltransferase involved in cell wall biosynthesis